MKSIKSSANSRVKGSSGSGRTQNELKRRGGQSGNVNAKKKALAWLASYDLTSLEGIQGFLREVVKHTWIGDLGTRQASALNSTCGLLLQYDQNILEIAELRKRADEFEKEYELFKRQSLLSRKPFPIDEQWIQTLTPDEQAIITRAIKRAQENPGEREIANHMTKEEQITIAKAIKRIENANLPIEEQLRLKQKKLEATPGAFDTGPDLETLKREKRETKKEER